jgi:hypothetical protein
MLSVTVREDRIHVGDRFSFTLQRTLRIPDDEKTYPLPPGFGPFPVHRIDDYAHKVPTLWRERGGFFVPMYQREALWLQVEAAWWKPNAVKVAVGGINAVSGEPWSERLHADPQNYIVCPDQPWLDGINAGEETIRQFVAVPLGSGETIEEQLTGAAEFGGIQVQVFEPKPGRFPDIPPPGGDVRFEAAYEEIPTEMGVAAGGRMHQKIYPDGHGIDTWDEKNYVEVFINIVNSEQYYAITGRKPPPSPISPKLYTDMGLPWFSLYDEDRGDVAASERLRSVKSLAERDWERDDVPNRNDEDLRIDLSQVVGLKPDKKSQ